jgi:hypothetical protein
MVSYTIHYTMKTADHSGTGQANHRRDGYLPEGPISTAKYQCLFSLTIEHMQEHYMEALKEKWLELV